MAGAAEAQKAPKHKPASSESKRRPTTSSSRRHFRKYPHHNGIENMIVGSAAPSPTPPRVHGDIPVGSGISRAMATTSSIVVVIAMTLFSSTKFILFGNDTTHHPPVTTQGKTHSSLSSSSHHVLDLRGSNRRRLPSLLRGGYADPKTVDATNRPLLLPEESFVIPAYRLDELRHREPTVVYRHPPDMDNNMGVVVDVLSIGSNTRPEYVSIIIITRMCLISHSVDTCHNHPSHPRCVHSPSLISRDATVHSS